MPAEEMMHVVNEEFKKTFADRTEIKSDFLAFCMQLNYPRGVDFLTEVCGVEKFEAEAEDNMPAIVKAKLFGKN